MSAPNAPHPSLACPPDELAQALALAGQDGDSGLARIENLLGAYPGDPRLHFLRGSILAGLKRYEAAMAAIASAVEIAPSFAVARFQLGLLHFTSGDAQSADQIWRPLLDLAEDEPLRLFARGLLALAQDDWRQTIALLERGIELNTANAPMNTDMKLVVEELRAKFGGEVEEGPVSSAQMLLRRYDLPGTKH